MTFENSAASLDSPRKGGAIDAREIQAEPLASRFASDSSTAMTDTVSDDDLAFAVRMGALKAEFLEAGRNPVAPNRTFRANLDSETIPPRVFRRAAERFSDTFPLAMARVLARPGFHTQHDLEPLLRQRLRRHFERPPLPSLIPTSEPDAKFRSPHRWTPPRRRAASRPPRPVPLRPRPQIQEVLPAPPDSLTGAARHGI